MLSQLFVWKINSRNGIAWLVSLHRVFAVLGIYNDGTSFFILYDFINNGYELHKEMGPLKTFV